MTWGALYTPVSFLVHVLNKMLDDKATARLLMNLGSDDGYTPTRNCRLPTVTHCTD